MVELAWTSSRASSTDNVLFLSVWQWERLVYYLHKLCQDLWPSPIICLKISSFLRCILEDRTLTPKVSVSSQLLLYIHSRPFKYKLAQLYEKYKGWKNWYLFLAFGFTSCWPFAHLRIHLHHKHTGSGRISLRLWLISVSWPLTPLTRSAVHIRGDRPWLKHQHLWSMCLLISSLWGEKHS